MPITPNRRPPGRRDSRRPKGHALPASRKRPDKRAQATAAIPTAQQAVDHLRETGEDDMADAVSTVIQYAANPVFGNPTPALSLNVDKAFRDHVKAAAETAGVDATATVLEGFEKFLTGAWVPPQPRRSAKGSKPDKVSVSVRVPPELVKRVDTRAEEFAGEQGWSMARGYKLNARQVAIAYLEHVYPMPEKAPATE